MHSHQELTDKVNRIHALREVTKLYELGLITDEYNQKANDEIKQLQIETAAMERLLHPPVGEVPQLAPMVDFSTFRDQEDNYRQHLNGGALSHTLDMLRTLGKWSVSLTEEHVSITITIAKDTVDEEILSIIEKNEHVTDFSRQEDADGEITVSFLMNPPWHQVPQDLFTYSSAVGAREEF